MLLISTKHVLSVLHALLHLFFLISIYLFRFEALFTKKMHEEGVINIPIL